MRLKLYISLIVFIFVFSYTLFSGYKTSTTFLPDFSIFYNSAKDISRHVLPYKDKTLFTVFNYPIISSLFFLPFIFLTRTIAQILFFSLNIVCIFLLANICFLLLKKRQTLPDFLIAVTFILLAFPTKFTLGMGQVNLIAYSLLLGGFHAMQKKRMRLLFFCTITVILLKPILGLTLLVFLFEKQWKQFFIIFFITLGILFFAPYLMQQPDANIIFIQNLLHQSFLERGIYYNQGLLGFIARITNNISVQFFFNFFSTALLTFVTFWKMVTVALAQKLSLILTLLVIIDPLSWQHHFVFLIFPFFFTFFLIQKSKKYRWFVLYFLSYGMISWNIKTPQLFIYFPQSLILSHVFFGSILLLFLQLFLSLRKIKHV